MNLYYIWLQYYFLYLMLIMYSTAFEQDKVEIVLPVVLTNENYKLIGGNIGYIIYWTNRRR